MSTPPIPASLLNLILGNKNVTDAAEAGASDIVGMAKGLVPNNPLTENKPQLIKQLHEEQAANEAAENSPERKSHGAFYRNVAVPAAMAVGVNVPGMEESASRGSVGGVLGHAAAPLAVQAAGMAIARIPGEHPQVATEALQEHVKTGGSTFDPRTGENLAGSRHYAVGVSPETAQARPTAPTPEQYSSFVADHRDILARHPNTAVGTQYDPTTGLHRMEVVGTTTSKQAALDLAAHLGEDHAYHLATDNKVPTGATGDWQPSPMSTQERLQQLRAATPKKEMYSGTHFSDAKLDIIDGARRGSGTAGQPATGSEAARLRLGSKTGMGLDAPGGFYTYVADSLPDSTVAFRKNAYKVRGQFSFGTTESPEFQSGYVDGVQRAVEAGADPQTAHQLGLNAAEHALREAGYDGYYSPKHPNVRFHFGSSKTAPISAQTIPELNLGPYGPPKADFSGSVPKENLGFDFEPPKDYGNSARAEVERRMGGPLPRGQAERRQAPTQWPEQYRNGAQALDSAGGGGANYTADDLAALKAKHGISNGSGESAASVEAINRAMAEKARGVQRFRIDTRSGKETPLIGVDAVDVKPSAHEIIVQRSSTGDVELARGRSARRVK